MALSCCLVRASPTVGSAAPTSVLVTHAQLRPGDSEITPGAKSAPGGNPPAGWTRSRHCLCIRIRAIEK
eukprot:146170-Chlamydomonas_euryale.AAC.1